MACVRKPLQRKKGLVFSSTWSTCQKRQFQASTNDEGPQKRQRTIASATCEDAPPMIDLNRPLHSHSKKTRVLILSDTHGQSKLPGSITNLEVDVVLHCGDLSEFGTLEEYQRTIDLLKQLNAPIKFVIAGNHDLTLDRKFWLDNATAEASKLHAQAEKLWQQTGDITLLKDGTHTIDLENGTRLSIYANSATPKSSYVHEWAFGHDTGLDIYNLNGSGISYGTCDTTRENKISEADAESIDIMMTHGPPKYRLDRTDGGDNIGCPHLFRATRRVRPILHAFGHVHSGFGAQRIGWRGRQGGHLPQDDDDDDGIDSVRVVEGEGNIKVIDLKDSRRKQETLFINAALMGNGDSLDKMPWLVELELPLIR